MSIMAEIISNIINIIKTTLQTVLGMVPVICKLNWNVQSGLWTFRWVCWLWWILVVLIVVFVLSCEWLLMRWLLGWNGRFVGVCFWLVMVDDCVLVCGCLLLGMWCEFVVLFFVGIFVFFDVWLLILCWFCCLLCFEFLVCWWKWLCDVERCGCCVCVEVNWMMCLMFDRCWFCVVVICSVFVCVEIFCCDVMNCFDWCDRFCWLGVKNVCEVKKCFEDVWCLYWCWLRSVEKHLVKQKWFPKSHLKNKQNSNNTYHDSTNQISTGSTLYLTWWTSRYVIKLSNWWTVFCKGWILF